MKHDPLVIRHHEEEYQGRGNVVVDVGRVKKWKRSVGGSGRGLWVALERLVKNRNLAVLHRTSQHS
jgi:hypothetical protein